MIFAAGLGTRLRPITNEKPKALVEIDGMPLLEIVIRRLKWFGIKDIIINIHHFGEQVLHFLDKNNRFDINIKISDERELLLDTGGGLKKAQWFFTDGPFLIYNTDVISNIDLRAMLQQHQEYNAMATLAIRKRATSRYFLFNKSNELVGWTNEKTDEVKMSKLVEQTYRRAFSGVHIATPQIFEYMPEEEVFSIVEVYLKAATEQSILGYAHDNDFWLDVGKIPQLESASRFLSQIELA